MAEIYYATYRRFNGVDWDIFYFKTNIAQVVGLQEALAARALKLNAVYFVEGIYNEPTNVWVGNIPELTELYNGLTIRFRVANNGTVDTYLNLNSLGVKKIWRYVGEGDTTYWKIGSIVTLTYDHNADAWFNEVTTAAKQNVFVNTTPPENPAINSLWIDIN